MRVAHRRREGWFICLHLVKKLVDLARSSRCVKTMYHIYTKSYSELRNVLLIPKFHDSPIIEHVETSYTDIAICSSRSMSMVSCQCERAKIV